MSCSNSSCKSATFNVYIRYTLSLFIFIILFYYWNWTYTYLIDAFLAKTGWANEKRVSSDLQTISFEELDQHLRRFYAEARSKDGKPYSRSTLLSLRNGIERYLSLPPVNRPVKFSQDPRFSLSNKMLVATIKQLKREGKENTRHKPTIEKQDILKLKSHSAISPEKPLSLLRNVWFHTTLFWCRRGLWSPTWVDKDEFCLEFATMTHDESTKNHPGGLKDVQSFEKLGRMYKIPSPMYGYTALKNYISKLNPNCDAFFQFPKRNWSHTDEVWYENRPLGVNKLSSMMKELIVEAELSKVYTNHSVRATAITLRLLCAGLPDRQIMAISGHRSESSLKSYSSRPSTSQLQQSSNVLSLAIGDVQNEERAILPASETTHKLTSNARIQMSRQELVNSIFSECKIDQVNISFNK